MTTSHVHHIRGAPLMYGELSIPETVAENTMVRELTCQLHKIDGFRIDVFVRNMWFPTHTQYSVMYITNSCSVDRVTIPFVPRDVSICCDSFMCPGCGEAFPIRHGNAMTLQFTTQHVNFHIHLPSIVLHSKALIPAIYRPVSEHQFYAMMWPLVLRREYRPDNHPFFMHVRDFMHYVGMELPRTWVDTE